MMQRLLMITVHCSDSTVEEHHDISVIDDWHKERGFKFYDDKEGRVRHVGYHYFIKRDGTLQYGRPLWKVGAHVKAHNTGNIGICMAGKRQFEREQFIALADLVAHLLQVCGLDVSDVYPHSHFDPVKKKHCPGFDPHVMIRHWRPDLFE